MLWPQRGGVNPLSVLVTSLCYAAVAAAAASAGMLIRSRALANPAVQQGRPTGGLRPRGGPLVT